MKSKTAAFNAFYWRRLKRHRSTANESHEIQQNDEVDNVRTKKDVYVAYWHYDKEVLQHFDKGFSFVPNKLDVTSAKDSGLYGQVGGFSYSQADNYKDPSGKTKEVTIALVPTFYNVANAKSDLELARKEQISHDKVERAKEQVSISSDTRIARNSSTSRNRTESIPAVTQCSSSDSNEMNVSGKRGKRRSNNASEKRAKVVKETTLTMIPNNQFLRLNEDEQRSYLNKLREDIRSFKEWKKAELAEMLDTKNCLARALNASESINESNLKELQKMKLSKENQLELKHHLEILERDAGLNRLSLTARNGNICKDRKLCEQIYGFADFDFLLDFIYAAFDLEYVKPTNLTLSRGGAKNNKDRSLSEVEQILLTLVFTNTRWSYGIIGLMFGVGKSAVAKYITKWMPMLGERGDMMSHLLIFLDSAAYDALEPESYKEVGLRKVAALVDGKDFLTETVRVDRVMNCAQASNKMHASAFRVLTWSLPCGAVVERTPAFLSRASEKGIMSAWGKRNRLKFPVGYVNLGDKGFDNTASCYVNYNTTLHPSFLSNKRFTKGQVNHNTYISQKRYSCEVVYQRVTRVGKLSGIYRREWFQHFENIVGWAHGRSNLCYKYLQK